MFSGAVSAYIFSLCVPTENWTLTSSGDTNSVDHMDMNKTGDGKITKHLWLHLLLLAMHIKTVYKIDEIV